MTAGREILCEQGDAVWMHERCGRVTASRMADVMDRLKGGKSGQKREKYKMELLTEQITGRNAEHFVTNAMAFGIENERLARTAFEMAKGVDVQRVGMFVHPTIERSAASPDGMIGDTEILEIKVPNTATHLRYFMDGVMPEDYVSQVQWQLACTGRQAAWFCSYDPRLPEDFGLFITRLERDDKLIAEMECEVTKFLAELNAMAEKLLANRAPLPACAEGVEPMELPAEGWLASQVGVSGGGE